MATAAQRAQALTYRDAATDHLTVAGTLYDADHLVLANYVAGLAVECMLRAYRYMIDRKFDSRHDMGELYKLAGFGDIVPRQQVESTAAALGEVVSLWSNDHRFLTVAALRKRWTDRGLYRGIKGDFVRELVRRVINSADRLVTVGAARWKSSFAN